MALSSQGPETVQQLDERLSRPTEGLLQTLAGIPGDIMFLGAGGKMGPTTARMARRAADQLGPRRRIIAVSRFSRPEVRRQLEQWGVETLQGDLLDDQFLRSLPDVPNLVFMAGLKFGTAGDPSATWAVNCCLPALVSRRFAGSRIVAFSTGNVYGMTPAAGPGSREDDEPRPVGEYAMAALGRERVFQYFSRTLDTPMVLLRLNYACEMRYGVLVDLAQMVRSGQPIDVSMGYVNVIWQADASAMALAALAHTTVPPRVVNIAGPEKLRVRDICQRMGQLMNRPVQLAGAEQPDAFLSDGRLGYRLLGQPTVPAETLIEWTVQWIERGGATLGKPTAFQVRDGRY